MERRDFLRGTIAGIAGLFLGFKEKLFAATKIAVDDDKPQGAEGFPTLKEWFPFWSGWPPGNKGSLWFWTNPDPNVVDAVEFGSRFRVAQNKGDAVINHAGWSAVVPLTPGVLHHVCYVWDNKGQHTVWLDGKEVKT